MKAAGEPRSRPQDARLLVVDVPRERFHTGRLADLPSLLDPGDLLVVNDAATLPASLQARTRAGRAVELRLASHLQASRFTAVLFGPGDWRTRTEDREPPPIVAPGESLTLAGGEVIAVEESSSASPRLLTIRLPWEGADLWSALYRLGRPVQYSYLARDLTSAEVQTPFSSRPWAMEPPSASMPLRYSILGPALRKGVRLASITHAAGLSSTGDAALDERLPFPERWEVPERTARLVQETRQGGGRVVAAGTTVVRALESAARLDGRVAVVSAGAGVTDLRLGPARAARVSGPSGENLPSFRTARVVDGLLSGLHEAGTSHFDLLRAFAPEALLLSARALAEADGFRAHELGDVQLVLSATRAGADVR